MSEIFVNPIVYTGTPENLQNRDIVEVRTYEYLDGLGIQFTRIEHEPAETIAACEEIDRVLGAKMCKNLFLCNRQKTVFYLLMMPGEKPFRTKDLSAQIQSARLSFADEEYMVSFLDIRPGSVSVMGLMNDKDNRVNLLIDHDLFIDEYVGVHPCVNTGSLKIRMDDIIHKFLPATGHTYREVFL